MAGNGYYRFPTIQGDTVVFTSEDDLWTVPSGGGVARRLTANLGAISHPHLSPGGSMLAFTGREEGHNEVYTMPAEGGPVQRITYLGVNSSVVGWSADGTQVLFSSDHAQPFGRLGWVYSIASEGGSPQPYHVGPAVSISIQGKRVAIGRNNADPARWKRYRGGTAGDIWIDNEGEGEFRRLLLLDGNVARPMCIGARIYFLSDHDGIGNLYSCDPDGSDVRAHTRRRDYYVRFPNSDDRRIVYQAGADLFLYDTARDQESRIEIEYLSPRVHRQRRFVEAAKFLESYHPHPLGHSVAITTRGKSYTLGNFEGPVALQTRETEPTRSRLTQWLNDGKRIVTVTDVDGMDMLEIHVVGSLEAPTRLTGLDIGRPVAIRVSPIADQIALANHRNELICLDLVERTMELCDRNEFGGFSGMDWSPDGRWIAYAAPVSQYQTAIKLWDRTSGAARTITRPILRDTQPAFDPEGKYLYFIGERELNPVYDNLHFDLGFPKGARPYLLTLRADLPSPFIPAPHPPDSAGEIEAAIPPAAGEETAQEKPEHSEEPLAVRIDLDAIEDRIVPFPVPEGIYRQIAGVKGKILFISYPVEGALNQGIFERDQAKGSLEIYDIHHLKHETLVSGISSFELSRDGKTMVYRSGPHLRALRTGEKPNPKSGPTPGRKSGFIDLDRVKVAIDPASEWRQMAREAWTLQRDFFWTENLSGVNWELIWDRYAPLIDRVGTRGEFSDLMWEMQGELGTSHAYEIGGDYRKAPAYLQGFLGADFAYDQEAGAYRVEHIVRGTAGELQSQSPLLGPGIRVKIGDKLLAINGRVLDASRSPQELLVNQADAEVVLTVEDDNNRRREVTVRALNSEFPARYREWVETNRERVHQETGGRVGYVHIPDMGARGYSEFHRLYLAEVAYDGLIVDVRYNGGGHVSQLLIEKLARRRVGYDIPRWGKPDPYPAHSVAGPMVAITNQWAGSDGDIFSHVFKLMKLGTLIGKRTWGGVIGINPRNALVDGAITTQPEYSFWFEDVGWGVENYGTDPHVDIDITPQDYARGNDPQMDRAISLILEELDKNPPIMPSFTDRPDLSLPFRTDTPGI